MTTITPMLVDHHCHLDFDTFDVDRDEVVARARAAGVGPIVSISTRVSTFEALLAMVTRYPEVYCSVGTHPHQAGEERGIPPERFVELSADPRVVAIGEAGLDYHYDYGPRDAQVEGFRTQIAAARETGLPLVIHARDADDDTGDILEDEMKRGAFSAVLHCYTGGLRLAVRALEMGLYVSFTGIMTYRSAADIRAVAAAVPLDRLLVETDAPYLSPPPHRGKRNEPAFVVETARCLAEVKGVSLAEVALATTENFYRLYNTVPRGAAERLGSALDVSGLSASIGVEDVASAQEKSA